MKITFSMSIAFVFPLLFLSSCDVVNEKDGYTEPYHSSAGANGGKVLLEDYTGMRCVNCPAAAEEAHLLQQTFGESLVVVSVHAGGLAIPNGIFQPDLRTEAGNTYYKQFGFAGTPVGMVNRKKYAGSVGLYTANWANAIQDALSSLPDTRIAVHAQYAEERAYECTLEVAGLSPKAEANLMLWLVEDSIATPQVIPGGVDRNYVQRHVLRAALNGTGGETVTPDENGKWNGTRTYTLPSDAVAEQCSIVALVALPSSTEIIAVAESRIE